MLRYIDIQGEFTSPACFSLVKETANPFYYWSFFEEDAPQLAKVAKRIFSMSISTAACERLFSNFGQIHSKVRNRLNFEKTLKISQLRWKIYHDQNLISSKAKKRKVVENYKDSEQKKK